MQCPQCPADEKCQCGFVARATEIERLRRLRRGYLWKWLWAPVMALLGVLGIVALNASNAEADALRMICLLPILVGALATPGTLLVSILRGRTISKTLRELEAPLALPAARVVMRDDEDRPVTPVVEAPDAVAEIRVKSEVAAALDRIDTNARADDDPNRERIPE